MSTPARSLPPPPPPPKLPATGPRAAVKKASAPSRDDDSGDEILLSALLSRSNAAPTTKRPAPAARLAPVKKIKTDDGKRHAPTPSTSERLKVSAGPRSTNFRCYECKEVCDSLWVGAEDLEASYSNYGKPVCMLCSECRGKFVDTDSWQSMSRMDYDKAGTVFDT